jgi:hypothetical protein
MVLSGMVSDVEHHKVLNPVVRLALVDVVDVLSRSELAPKMALHNEAMLKNVDACSGELNISVSSDGASDPIP